MHFTTAGLHFPDDIQAEYIAFTDAADLLQNGSADGAWVMSGVPASAVTQALAGGCRLVDMDEDLLNRLKEKYPWYSSYIIPKGTYPGQDKDIRTSAVKMVMFTREMCIRDRNSAVCGKRAKDIYCYYENNSLLGGM